MDDREFFNNMADKWDEICCHPSEKVNYIMNRISLKFGNTVLDLGSGTGVTIPYLEGRIGEEGKITALDISEKMIDVSKKKNRFSNVTFEVCDYYNYSSTEKYDCILAYSCYPHFKDKDRFFEKSFSLIESGGKIVIAHIESREKLNSIHKNVEDKLDSDELLEVDYTAELMRKHGFKVTYTEDSSEYYICIAEKAY